MSDKLNVIETIAKQDKFSTFARLMGTSNTNEIFNGEGPFTVFVPTNDAFAKVPEATMIALLNEPGQTKLKALLSYHILPGKVMAANLISASSRKAFSGEELMFTDVNGLKVNGASVQARNLEATNGVVHALDTVLTPTRVPVAAAATTAPLTTPTAIASRANAAVASASATATPSATPAADSTAPSAVPAAAPTAPASADTKSIL